MSGGRKGGDRIIGGAGPNLVAAGRIDRTRWRLRVSEGRQTWHYLHDDEEAENWPQSYADKWHLGLPTGLPELPEPETPADAIQNGLAFYSKLQLPGGNWGAEFGGPMFLLPGIVFAWYLTGSPIPVVFCAEITNYLFSRAGTDGGWGLHIEAESSVLGTALNYAVLRIVGVDADDQRMTKARATLHRLGGCTHAPHWAKFWLALLGIVKWEIVNPIPPEAWLLPEWLPFHPWRWWVHIRYVYMPMGWFYSKRWTMKETGLIRELRKEMFVEPWEEIDWRAHRNSIAAVDNNRPRSWLLNVVNWLAVNIYEPYFRPRFLAKKAETWVAELIDMESENTDYLGLAPVNGAMNMVMYYVSKGPDSDEFKRARDGFHEVLWVNKEGMFCNGTNGIQCWDTAFTIQAVIEAGIAQDEQWRPMLIEGLRFLDDQQIRDEVPRQWKEHRHPRKGGWAFSNRHQGYPVSDCVSESLKAVIALQKTPNMPQLLDDRRIFDAVDNLLTFQNKTGGVASYEKTRGPPWLEILNASEIFDNIMIEYDYTECTTAVVTALLSFRRHWPNYRAGEIETFVTRALAWIKTQQYPDGSWYGSWGICFTYGTMFALESLAAQEENYQSSSVARRGCDFLISKQREDGGWSESYESCLEHRYIEHPSGSQVVMTAWALIGLMHADYPDLAPIRRGIQLIMGRQQPNGEWKQEAIEGVFNKSTMCSYPNYKFHFTIKALGMFVQKYPKENLAW